MNIGKAAVLALVASWAIYGQERIRIPVKAGGPGGGGGPPGGFYAGQTYGSQGYGDFNR